MTHPAVVFHQGCVFELYMEGDHTLKSSAKPVITPEGNVRLLTTFMMDVVTLTHVDVLSAKEVTTGPPLPPPAPCHRIG